MVKLKHLMLAALTVLGVSLCAEDQLLDYIPQDINAVIELKPNAFFNMPLIAELRKENADFEKSYKSLEADLKKYDLTVKDLPKALVVFIDKDNAGGGVIAKASINEARFVKLLNSKKAKENKIVYQKELLAGKEVYVFSLDAKDIPTGAEDYMNKKTVLSFLKKDIVLVCEYEDFADILKRVKAGNVRNNTVLMERRKQINASAPFWGIFSLPAKKYQTAEIQQRMSQNPTENIRGGSFALSFSGVQQRDINLEISVESKDNNSAMMLKMQTEGMIMMMSGTLFKDDPQLGAVFSKSIKIKQNGKHLKATAKIDRDLQGKLKDYAKLQSQKAAQKASQINIGQVKQQQ